MKPGQNNAGWTMAAMLALVCLTPPTLMLAPPSGGTVLAIFAPGTSPTGALMAATSAGARAAEPLGGGMLIRADMPEGVPQASAAAALRARGAIFVFAPLSGWACRPGLSAPRESRP
ncbi:hypothetical protein [Glycocaulis albus]|nr:hypothetical protein [Glycocaulis albus]